MECFEECTVKQTRRCAPTERAYIFKCSIFVSDFATVTDFSSIADANT
jgi:hypothetical protein